MIEHILYLSIGAMLVTFGVLAGALADRIRGNRRASSRAPRLAGAGLFRCRFSNVRDCTITHNRRSRAQSEGIDLHRAQ